MVQSEGRDIISLVKWSKKLIIRPSIYIYTLKQDHTYYNDIRAVIVWELELKYC